MDGNEGKTLSHINSFGMEIRCREGEADGGEGCKGGNESYETTGKHVLHNNNGVKINLPQICVSPADTLSAHFICLCL